MLRIVFAGERPSVKGPAILIDRDGVINRRRPDDYVLNFSQFTFVPGIRTALRQLAVLQLPMIVISNQAAVGKGLLDPATLQNITLRMQQMLSEDGTSLTAAYYCTHRQDEDCVCRKPKPALLRQAAQDFKIDLRRSIFIGDSETDVRAARAAGCKPVLFGSAAGARSSLERSAEVPVAVTASDLFGVAVKCLRVPVVAEPRSRSLPNDNQNV